MRKNLRLDVEILKSENRNLVYTVERLIQEINMLREKACFSADKLVAKNNIYKQELMERILNDG